MPFLNCRKSLFPRVSQTGPPLKLYHILLLPPLCFRLPYSPSLFPLVLSFWGWAPQKFLPPCLQAGGHYPALNYKETKRKVGAPWGPDFTLYCSSRMGRCLINLPRIVMPALIHVLSIRKKVCLSHVPHLWTYGLGPPSWPCPAQTI